MQSNLPKVKSSTAKLIRKHLLGTLSLAEQTALEQWLEQDSINRQLFVQTSALYKADKAIRKPAFPFKMVLLLLILAVAAIYFLISQLAIISTTQPVKKDSLRVTKPVSLLSGNSQTVLHDKAQSLVAPVKHKMYRFTNATLGTVMKKLRERYQIDYIIVDSISNRFTGSLPLDISLDESLRLLRAMGHIQLEKLDSNQVAPKL